MSKREEGYYWVKWGNWRIAYWHPYDGDDAEVTGGGWWDRTGTEIECSDSKFEEIDEWRIERSAEELNPEPLEKEMD